MERFTDRDDVVLPAYTGRLSAEPLLARAFPDSGRDPEEAYRFVHDELMLDGNSRLNLATFVTTWMEPQAEKLMAEAFGTNAIDKDEYPSTARMEQRCTDMLGDLFHAGPEGVGVSTIGSSEAVMLAGLAMKTLWRARAGAGPERVPNLVLGTNVQVVWEKFCRYFDVEPRYVPMAPGRYVCDPDEVAAACDADTIGAVAILGTTFTGQFEDVAGICAALDAVAFAGGPDVPVHVDAASGGFVAPFLDPGLEWDFRLPRVASINVSGHKYGLTYPGIGFALWRDKSKLPGDLVFHVDYLGGDMPTFTLNFSRPGNQIVGQYYNLIRLGRDGYARIMGTLRDTARWLAGRLADDAGCEVLTGGDELPVITWRYRDVDAHALSHELRAHGWQVPAYRLPEGAEEEPILRVVVREGMSMDLAGRFADDVAESVARLRAGDHRDHNTGFRH